MQVGRGAEGNLIAQVIAGGGGHATSLGVTAVKSSQRGQPGAIMVGVTCASAEVCRTSMSFAATTPTPMAPLLGGAGYVRDGYVA